MDIGNDVDLSNENITPLWKRRADNCSKPTDSIRVRTRPLSYHIHGVVTTDFPAEDDSSYTLSQPAERLVVAPACQGKNVVMLKHVLHKPSRKSRVVRSISIGHFSSGLFSLSKFRSEDSRSASLDNRACGGDKADHNRKKNINGEAVWAGKCPQDPQRETSAQWNLNSQKDGALFRSGSHSPDDIPHNSSPIFSNNNYNHNDLSLLPPGSSPPAQRTPTPSHSSTSSIPSLSSLTSSDPPTPRSPSPALHRQPSTSSATSQDTRPASSSSSLSSPSFSPTISPSSSSIVLSTHSPAALKMGTHQLIPKALASDIRQSKAPPSGPQGQGLAGLLGLDHSKRALKALSMVETGTYFSTGGSKNEGADADSESPGALRRGIRSTSYRRAVVSGDDTDNPNNHPLSQSGVGKLGSTSPASPASPQSESLSTPGTPKLGTPGTTNPASPGTIKPTSPTILKPASPGNIKVGKHLLPVRWCWVLMYKSFDPFHLGSAREFLFVSEELLYVDNQPDGFTSDVAP